MSKISLIGQIAEIDREIAMRRDVYPRRIASRQMKQAEADMLMDRIHAVRASLIFLKQHENDIRTMIAAKKAVK